MGVQYSTTTSCSSTPPSTVTEEETLERTKDGLSHRHVRTRIDFDQDLTIVPVTRNCFYCCKEGKEHPIEHFRRYPCCGHYLCRDCMWKNTGSCGECITVFPGGNELALLWIQDRIGKEYPRNDRFRNLHLLGKIHINGSHLFLDELLSLPTYQYKKLEPRCALLSVMNPSNVQLGVKYLEHAAKNEIISAMLDLADAYCTNFENDSFEKCKEKAEHWYVTALGKGNRICPRAFTRYGDFLKWEQRFTEAKDMYRIAAMYGHARGQHEYAVCLLGGDDVGNSDVSNDDTLEAIQFLCKACEKGFYAPSYTLLAKVLIGIAEKAYGTVNAVGRSPLPRAIRILDLAKDCPYGTSQAWEHENLTLLDDYKGVDKCSNCGQNGSKTHPLRRCGTCGVMTYCSNVCQKRDYRDGHRFDCCSSKVLVNFNSIRLTMPWISKAGWKGGIEEMPRLLNTGEKSLVQMVEDETDELYGEDDQDYDDLVLINLMFRMRKNLETYLNKELHENKNAFTNLQNQITKFSQSIEEYPGCQDFVQAMNLIRTLGNTAVHYENSSETKTLVQVECEDAVREYRSQKKKYEKYRETKSNVNAPIVLLKASDAWASNKTPDEGNDERAHDLTLKASQFSAIPPTNVQNEGDIKKEINTSKKKKKKKRKTSSSKKKPYRR